MVFRVDDAQVLKKYIDPSTGYLHIEGYFARTGILKYRDAVTGKMRSELVLPEELSNTDSVASYNLLPFANDHPVQDGQYVMLDASNTTKFAKGWTGSNTNLVIKELDEQNNIKLAYISGDIVIVDVQTISLIGAGKIQLSLGYTCDVEETSGYWYGEWYDAIQRNRKGNHLALVSLGRAGSEASIKFDGLISITNSVSGATVIMGMVRIDNQDHDIPDASKAEVIRILRERDQFKADADKASAALAKVADRRIDKASVEAIKKLHKFCFDSMGDLGEDPDAATDMQLSKALDSVMGFLSKMKTERDDMMAKKDAMTKEMTDAKEAMAVQAKTDRQDWIEKAIEIIPFLETPPSVADLVKLDTDDLKRLAIVAQSDFEADDIASVKGERLDGMYEVIARKPSTQQRTDSTSPLVQFLGNLAKTHNRTDNRALTVPQVRADEVVQTTSSEKPAYQQPLGMTK
jgi:uncharacterized protein